jgi:hypothetical protein
VERAAPFEGGAERSLGRTDGADGRRRSPEIGLGVDAQQENNRRLKKKQI